MQEAQVQSLGQHDPLEEEMAARSSSPLGNPVHRGGWQAAVHGVAESGTTERLGTALAGSGLGKQGLWELGFRSNSVWL